MIITDAQELRALTGSYYQNNDFERIATMVTAVERDVARTVGLTTLDNLTGEAREAAQVAVAYMAVMRHYRLNDLSHEDAGRKAKIDRENEARPFEWQLARDERAHLEEYYRALDRLADALRDTEAWQQSPLGKAVGRLIVTGATHLSLLTGLDNSPWLYLRLVPYMTESQQFVRQAYGGGFDADMGNSDAAYGDVQTAAARAVALGGVALMGRRTSLQALPYGLFRLMEQDGGGNGREQGTLERIDDFLKHLSREQHYWLNEMRTLRDLLAAEDGDVPARHLVMPDNERQQKFMRV